MACEFPITIKNPVWGFDPTATQYIPVPCRKCPACLAKRSNGWIFRLLQHDKIAQGALFVTLTYSNEHVPLTPKKFMTLHARHYQLFMKRLRKMSPQPRKRAKGEPENKQDRATALKYYAVGEYGSETFRPHYHAIIFNSDRELIEKAWQYGAVHCDIVNGSTVAYTTKYINKGKLIPVHSNDDRTPEFQLISKGIGIDYINDNTIAFHQADISRLYLTTDGGHKVPMPALYRSKIFTETQRSAQARLARDLVSSIEDKKRDAYKSTYGSLDNYYKSEVESKRAAVSIFRDRQRSRNKI